MPAPQPSAVERHPHLGDPLPAGWVRVDLHSHTMWSGDSTTTPEEVEEAVVAAGLDVLCITDHHAIKGAAELAGRLPCRVIVGEELRTHHGEIIGLFLTEQVSITAPGSAGLQRIRDTMTRFRTAAPATIAGHAVTEAIDLEHGAGDLPAADVLIWRLAGGRRVIMRPSGTEPKLKSYYEVRVEVGAGEDLAAARARARAELDALRDAHQAMVAADA